MAEKDTIFKGKIKQEGMFDFKEFYSFAYDWIISEGYDLTEKKYSEKSTKIKLSSAVNSTRWASKKDK